MWSYRLDLLTTVGLMRSCHSHECSEIGTRQRTRFRVDKTNGVVNLERDTSYTIIHKVCVIEAMTTILCTTPGESLERLILRLLINIYNLSYIAVQVYIIEIKKRYTEHSYLKR